MNPKSILIIDDEPFLRSTMALILGKAGYSIHEAASANEALQALANCPVDLIFLDLKMPGRNGLDLLPEIEARYPDIPVLILTADGSLEKAIEALRMGARDYLLKPVEPGQIILRVDDLLKQNNYKGKAGPNFQQDRAPVPSTNKDFSEQDDCSSRPHPEAGLERGPFRLDFLSREAFLFGDRLEMDHCTFEYLATLLRHAPHPISYETLVFEAQGYQLTHSEAQDICRWRIHRLHKIIEDMPQEPRFILNVPGMGYWLKID